MEHFESVAYAAFAVLGLCVIAVAAVEIHKAGVSNDMHRRANSEQQKADAMLRWNRGFLLAFWALRDGCDPIQVEARYVRMSREQGDSAFGDGAEAALINWKQQQEAGK